MWRARVLIALGVVVVLVASYWTADIGQTVGERSLPKADKVLIFGIPRLSLDDVTPEKTPNLYELGEKGAIGALRVKTRGSNPDVAEAYASLGAGASTQTGSAGMTAFESDAEYRGMTAIENQRLLTGTDLSGAVVIPGVPEMVADHNDHIGTLATQLRNNGHGVAVVSNADILDSDGRRIPRAPAALAVSDRDGIVPHGTVAADLVREQSKAPFGISIRSERFVDAVEHGFRSADVVVADPGETLRAADYLSRQSKTHAVVSRHRALEVTDDILGALHQRVGPDTLIIVAGLTPGANQWALTPIVVAGPGVTPGQLASPSTHRAGMVTLTDIAPTVLATLGITVPDSLGGSPLRETSGEVSWDRSRRFGEMFDSHAQTTAAMMLVFIIAQSAVYLAAVILFRTRRIGPRLQAWLEVGVLTFAAWPLATFLLRLSVAASSLYYGSLALTWLIALVIALAVRNVGRYVLEPLFLVCLATFAVITIDLATGAHLLFGSFFGYTPITSGRYFGINNSVFAILAACTVVLCATVVDWGREKARDRSLWFAVALAAIAVIVDGAPWIGADVGGILTLVPVFGVMLWALSGRRVRWPYLVGAAAAGVAALVVAIGFDLLRDPDQRTHIGRFFLGVGYGNDQAISAMIAEKWRANTAALAQSAWAWAIPIIAVYSSYVLVVARGWRSLLPEGSPLRIGVIAGLAVGLVGWLLNDSGIVVTALVFVYLGPLLVLTALRDPERRLRKNGVSERPLQEMETR